MRSNRILKYINIAIGVIAVAALSAGYWFLYRPLGETSGEVHTLISKRATISRDALGAPHIAAESTEDALFAQGWAASQDRLWQMESLRRFAGGEVAEIFGVAGLEIDREARNLRMRRIAEEAERAMPAADRKWFAAYARGVNAYIESHRGRLPIEFTLLGLQPRPWRVADSVLIGLHMVRDLTSSFKDELLKRLLLAGGDKAKVDFLMPVRSGTEQQPGSNAWALSGKLTASGRPLLANDMHLQWAIPGIWHIAYIEAADGYHAGGVTLPGVPGIVVGHNRDIAWGITNLHYDVQDLYEEKFDERTGAYLFQGQTEQARAEREIILVKGARPVEAIVWVTRHGPLMVTQDKLGPDRNVSGLQAKEHLALRWAAAEPASFQYPFMEIGRARNWTEFRAALSRFSSPGSNFVYADVNGNIGYQAAGRLPIRKGWPGDLPVDGSSGNFEWQGFIPFEELPSSYNPPSGMIVTANQNPFPADYRYPVAGNFASPYRAAQIRALLAAGRGWRAEDMPAVQKDVYSAFSHFLARQIVAACDRRKVSNPSLSGAIALLREWNGQMEKNLPQPLLVTLAYPRLRRAAGDAASPGKGLIYDVQLAPAVIERLLRERPAGWVKDWDELLVRSLDEAVEEGSRSQGPDVKRWIYGKYTEMTITHPIGNNLPWAKQYFNLGPVELSGSATTVKQTTRRLAPSMRMAADLDDWERSWLNLPIGESGQVLSSHYKDQWDRYYAGRSYPMQFGKVDAKSVLTLVP